MANKMMTMAGLGAMVLGVVLIIVLYALIPVIGDQIDGAITIDTSSEWSITRNSDMPTGHAFWSIIGPFITLCTVIFFVSVVIFALYTIRETGVLK